jgi:hypothetical protein
MGALNGESIGDVLWFGLAVAWIALLAVGLEADKPLSGDLPGHVDRRAARSAHAWDDGDRLGETAAWIAFGLVCAALPFLLYWVLTAHVHLPRLPGVPM